MLEILNQIVNTDARLQDNGFTYDVHYSVGNNEILTIQCMVTQEKEGMSETLGYIRKENGRVNMDFNEGIPMIEHMKVYDLIVDEIENTLIALPAE